MKFVRVVLACTALSILSVASAQSFEEADAAYRAKDYEHAFPLMQALASAGNPRAEAILGAMYLFGFGTVSDKQLFYQWTAKAASAGDTVGMFNWANVLAASGAQGVQTDALEATRLFRAAAEQGHIGAEAALARRLTMGWGAVRDDVESIVWYRKAAYKGNADAEAGLCFAYNYGRGVPTDLQQSYFWCLLAAAGGNESASRLRDLQEKMLPLNVRLQAQAAARNWRPN